MYFFTPTDPGASVENIQSCTELGAKTDTCVIKGKTSVARQARQMEL